MAGSETPVEYKATVTHDSRRLGDTWCVEAERWVTNGRGWDHVAVKRYFILRWSAVRFANSQRRILRAFRKYDRQQAKVEIAFTREGVPSDG
jgi:hypothetical protein